MKIAPIIVGISGASGAIYSLCLLNKLKELDIPRHLIVSEGGLTTLKHECNISMRELKELATEVYSNKDLAAAPSSGSFLTSAMIIAPCSIRTLSGIANSYNENLMIRAADVHLKQRRKLILMVRETPLHSGHLELMKKASDWGAIIAPPVPAFWAKPQTIDEMVDDSIDRILDLLNIQNDIKRWPNIT
ncbi:MAG: UbiX family flavin prenyltransferase [Alphaproteobacteria bacterium]